VTKTTYLYSYNYTCVAKCPKGFEIDFGTLSCKKTEPNVVLTYLCLGYIGSSSTIVIAVVLASKLVTFGKSSISDSAMAFLAPVD